VRGTIALSPRTPTPSFENSIWWISAERIFKSPMTAAAIDRLVHDRSMRDLSIAG